MIPSRSDYRQGRRFILCDLICGGDLLTTPLVIIDAGALDAFTGSRWTKLSSNKVRLHGFEPDVAECDKLNRTAATAGVDYRFYPVALARDSGTAQFYRFAEPAANSFYAANDRLVRRWCYSRSLTLASQFKVLERPFVQAASLADWAKTNAIDGVDFIKLNVQGAELDILRGAGALLNDTLGLLVEQTFNQTYKDAPLFGEVFDFIKNSGFCMFDIVGINRVGRTRSPIHVTDDRIFVVDGTWPNHQFLEGHFFYLRDPISESDSWHENSLSIEQCLKLACLAEMFGQIEYAFEILDWIASSPRSGRMAACCRELIKLGADLYRRVSDSPQASSSSPRANSDEVSELMLSPTAEEKLNPTMRKLHIDFDQLQDRFDALSAENASLRDALQQMHSSTSWKVLQPVRSLVGWVRKRGLLGRRSGAAFGE